MWTKRKLLGTSGALFLSAIPVAVRADEFDAFYKEIIAHPDLMADARSQREAPAIEYSLRSDSNFVRAFRAFAPRVKGATKKISLAARDLIVACEVSSPQVYEKRYEQPLWPGANSGVTIGVGYDLGYIEPDWLHQDWGGLLDGNTIKSLLPACRLRGAPAQAFCKHNVHIRIPWAIAQTQFMEKLLPRFVQETLMALPNAESLSGDSLGALVSLVYNRGSSFRKGGPRYSEMRDIYFDVQQDDLGSVPNNLLSMRRLWPKLPGLVKRREAEAALFRRGL